MKVGDFVKGRHFLLAAAVLAAVVVPLGGSAGLSYGPAPLPAWVVSGGGAYVSSVATSGTTAYLGGGFRYIGPAHGGAVSLDRSTGALSPSWPTVGGIVYAVEPDGAGGWFIGGSFTSVGLRETNNVAHIKSDGTLDESWVGGTDGPVNALAVSGSTVYAGGDFTSANGSNRQRLAAFDATTGALGTFNPGVSGVDDFVQALAISGTTLYVGGYFDTLGHFPRGTIRLRPAARTRRAPRRWNCKAGRIRAISPGGCSRSWCTRTPKGPKRSPGTSRPGSAIWG